MSHSQIRQRRKGATAAAAAVAARLRRIRILYADPDATDTSDDDEDGAIPKRAVYIFHTLPHVPCSSQPKYKGVRQRKWGRWAAEIRNPVSGCREWLGTFDNAEAAAAAYQSAAKQFKAKRSRNADDNAFFTKCDLAALNKMPFWAAMRRLESEILVPPPGTTAENRPNHIEKCFAMKNFSTEQQQKHSSIPIDTFVKFETTLDHAFDYKERQLSDFVIDIDVSDLIKLDGWFEYEYSDSD
uniref:AP2/ERF domain-containing protein n=1 Tax=Ananas comosus var. bracteatus TaxID=296719 RepID=A0A6V7NWX8_ANACO|nr:unnamed protein product [Ananas comosus var. bracteatus]